MRPRTSATIGLTLVILGFGLIRAEPVLGADGPSPQPADALLRLVPPDAALAVCVENLRDFSTDFLQSRLADDLQQVPVVREWLASEKYRQFERSRAQIEAQLGTNLTDLRDELLGDAVVLALQLPRQPAAASQPRGILIVKARDTALLGRLIRAVNSSQQESGELAGVRQQDRNGTAYHIREFPAGANRPPDWYVVYPDGTFAFSNSESMIQSVIDRKSRAIDRESGSGSATAANAGLGELPRVKAVQSRLPGQALARLFIDPRHFERLLADQPRPAKSSDARLVAIFERYIAAVDYVGAALTWKNDAIVIHSVETLNPSRLDPWLRRWAGDGRRCDLTLARVPPTAVAVASGHVDALAALDFLSQIMPDDDQARLPNLETLVSGLMLGQDLRRTILPRLGPGVVLYLETPPDSVEPNESSSSQPSSRWAFPLVAVVSLGTDAEKGEPPALAAAAENALRTLMAMLALDEKRAQGRSRITTRSVAGTTVTTLEPTINFAYAVDRAGHRLVLSTSPDAVARYLESAADTKAGERFRQLEAAAFAGNTTHGFIDWTTLGQRLAGRNRARLVQSLAARQQRSVDLVEHDLSHVLALSRLFQAAFVTSRFDADATAVHRTVGLVRRAEDRK